MQYTGGCHCGQNRFEAEGKIDQAMECNCSHCEIKGFLLWFIPRESFRLTTPEEGLSVYTFNKHVIKHHFCSRCGTQPFGLGVGPGGKAMAAINVRCVDGIDLATLKRVPFDGRNM